jgi:asparagine synthase (glutamine-hydrolysing)
LGSGDKKDMAAPLEYRCPMLDHRVVELAMTMPTTYLIRDGWHKWILRKAVEDLLPESVVWRRNKMGLPFPMSTFLQQSKAAIDHIVDGSSNRFLDHTQSDRIKTDWKLISFEMWHAMFVDQNIDLIEKAASLINETAAAVPGHKPEYLDTWESAAGPD